MRWVSQAQQQFQLASSEPLYVVAPRQLEQQDSRRAFLDPLLDQSSLSQAANINETTFSFARNGAGMH